MKYTIASALLLIVLIGSCLFCAFTVDHTVAQAEHLLSEALELHLRGEHSKGSRLVQEASDFWYSNQQVFGVLLRHDEIDSVIGEFARLQSYAITQDEDDFLSNCYALLAKLSHIREMEWPLLENIL